MDQLTALTAGPSQTTGAPSSSPTAAWRVLGNYELLEKILLDVDITDVFLLQRVNFFWQSLFKRSKPLQHKAWLEPTAPPCTPQQGCSDPLSCNEFVLFNPLLEPRQARHDMGLHRANQLPFLRYLAERTDGPHPKKFRWSISINPERLFDTARHGHESWRGLFLTSPPCTRLSLALPSVNVCSIVDPAGVTMGSILDVAAKAFDERLCRYRYPFLSQKKNRYGRDIYIQMEITRPEVGVTDEQPYRVMYDEDEDGCQDEGIDIQENDMVDSDDDEDIDDWAEPGGVAIWGWKINDGDNCEGCASDEE